MNITIKTTLKALCVSVLTCAALGLAATGAQAKEATMSEEKSQENTATIQTVMLAGGCFWCIATDFDALEGVVSTLSGYAGGTIENPTYENYHDNIPGKEPHIEVIQVQYDSTKLQYEDILDYFFRHIDPTDGDGQFCDRGAPYRPAIFVQNDEHKAIAETKMAEVARLLKQDVNVDILPDAQFWKAEEYHQDYKAKNPIRYKVYRWNCGRDQRVKELWGDK